MERKVVIVKETKDKIEKIKQKYNQLEMNDDSALKIIKLEATGNILKKASKIVGIITIISFFVPDPIPLIDEITLAGLYSLLKYSKTICSSKINDVLVTGDASLTEEEIYNIVNSLNKLSKNKTTKRR